MASKYIPWLDDSQALANAFNYTDFAAGLPSGSQRSQGFQPGTVSSAKCVNTALRQANLVAAALMDVVDPNGKTDLQSKRTDVATVILNGLRNMFAVKTVQWSSDYSTVTITTSQPFILMYASNGGTIINTSVSYSERLIRQVFTFAAAGDGNGIVLDQMNVIEESRSTSNNITTITLRVHLYKVTSTGITEYPDKRDYLSFLMEE